MYCPKCEQKVLGDICPNCGYKSMFKKMGDLGGTVTGSLEEAPASFTPTVPIKTKPNTGGFKPMDPLNSGESSVTEGEVSHGDKPVTGGFKPMDEIVPSKGKHVDRKFVEETKKRDLAKNFVWKKWMTVAASVAAVFIAILLFSLSPRENAYETAIADKIASEMIRGDELPLAYQYNNVVLDAIDFQVQDTDKSEDTATIRFTYVDVLSLADMFVGSMNDPSLFYTHCIDQIVSGSAPTITRTISVSFEEFESGEVKKLRAVDSIDLADVLTGGVASEYAKLTGGD